MALIACRECGKEISDQAAACPNCGCPVVRRPVTSDPAPLPAPTQPVPLLQRRLGLGTLALAALTAFMVYAVWPKSTDPAAGVAGMAAGVTPAKPAAASGPSRREAPAASEAAKESAWIAEMQLRVKSKLRDPSAAQFRNTKMSRKGGIPAVCGEVNSNNAFGGKAGFQRFVSAGSIQVLEEQMEAGGMNEVWSRFCD